MTGLAEVRRVLAAHLHLPATVEVDLLRRAADAIEGYSRGHTTAAETDGLTVNPGTGVFTHSGLVPGWLIVGAVATGPTGLRVAWLAQLSATSDTGGVGSKLLRAIETARLLAEIRQRLATLDTATRDRTLVGEEPDWPEPEHRRQPGRPRRTESRPAQALLRDVAVAYLEESDRVGVRDRLAERFGRTPGEIRWLACRCAPWRAWCRARATAPRRTPARRRIGLQLITTGIEPDRRAG